MVERAVWPQPQAVLVEEPAEHAAVVQARARRGEEGVAFGVDERCAVPQQRPVALRLDKPHVVGKIGAVVLEA